jgi:hypothetical protein
MKLDSGQAIDQARNKNIPAEKTSIEAYCAIESIL